MTSDHNGGQGNEGAGCNGTVTASSAISREALAAELHEALPAMVRVAYRITRDIELAKEAAQDAAVAAVKAYLKNPSSFPPEQVRGYLLGRVRWECMNGFRAQKRALALETVLREQPEPDPDGPPRTREQADATRLLAELFEGFTDFEQEIISARLDRVPPREIAAELKIENVRVVYRILERFSARAREFRDREAVRVLVRGG